MGKKFNSHKQVASAYRKEVASEMIEYQKAEPGFLPEENVVRQIKYESNRKSRIDRDVFKSLQKMKKGSLRAVIHGIGHDPFFVLYWSSFQLHQYERLFNVEKKKRNTENDDNVTILLDATGGVAYKIKYDDHDYSPVKYHIKTFFINCILF